MRAGHVVDLPAPRIRGAGRATDLWFNATENLQRIRDAGAADAVYPIHADARALPFGADFFDAIVSLDSFFYYGTDDLYLDYVARFVKPDGAIGIAGAGLIREFDAVVPAHLEAWWRMDRPLCLHSAGWWRRHWERTGVLDVTVADSLPDGWQCWRDWLRFVSPQNTTEIGTLETDRGTCLGYVRAVGRRRRGIALPEPIVSVPTQYEQRPLLRAGL